MLPSCRLGVPMSIAWDHLSEFEQFSLLIHGFSGEHRFMGLMKIAYCDESADQRPPGPKVYAVSGYLATASSSSIWPTTKNVAVIP